MKLCFVSQTYLKLHPQYPADTVVAHILLTQSIEHMTSDSTQNPKGQVKLLWDFVPVAS